jgi:DNA-binding response OmpR family regulator
MSETSPNGTAERSHIFCVNRSPAFLELLAELLQEEHYAVSTTTHHETAFAQILVGCPALVIIDLVSGDEDAWRLLARLSTDPATQSIPLLATSTDPRLIARAEAEPDLYRPDRFLIKPFDIAELLVTVATLLRTG